MRSIILSFFRKNWVELVLVPPIMIGGCYLLFGEMYFASVRNFLWLTLPVAMYGIIVSSACKWWRRVMHSRFRQMDDWWKRLIFSLTGYVSFHAVLIFVYWFLFKKMLMQYLVPTEEQMFILLVVNFSTLIIIVTLYEGITFFEKWKEAIIETEQLEKLTLENQFRSLQSQLNPHFLFNSFNVLSSLIAESPGRAERFVDELSNVYRYLLRSNEQETATVSDELRFIRSYFHLLETRHDRGISMEVKVGKAIAKQKLPALALQVLVENAVKHNEISPEKPLRIEVMESEGHESPLRGAIIVRNNIQRKATKPHSNHVGLDNLRQRYELLGIRGFEVVDDGKEFRVVLPTLLQEGTR